MLKEPDWAAPQIRLGDFDDDGKALRGDWLVLGEDMRKAARRIADIG